MKSLLLTSLLASMMLTFLVTTAYPDDKEKKKPRVYKHDFEGQDLSGRDFSKQILDDANFTDAVLTNARFGNSSLKNCNFQGATLRDTDLSYADLTGSDLRKSTGKAFFHLTVLNKVDLSGVDLNGANTGEMKFREAKLRGTKGFNQIYGCDFYMADLRGADLSTAQLLDRTNFRKAQYDQVTRWPNGFEIKDLGLVLVETKAEEEDQPKNVPSKDKSNDEAAFQKLDKNEDGVLSGLETKGFKEKDANGDGEISLAEFLGKSR